jgi:hypothetical protein
MLRSEIERKVTSSPAAMSSGDFGQSPQSRKGKNLARDPRCTLSVATQAFDLTVEGEGDATRFEF